MAHQSNTLLKTRIESQLADFFECRWVALYPTPVEASYALQASTLAAPFSRQIVAICDERSAQYSLLNSILGNYPVDRILRVDPDPNGSATTVGGEKAELLWWESVPYPGISSYGVESNVESFSKAPIRVIDATVAPLSIQSSGADYCLLSDMRGITGHAYISCAALIGVSRRAGSAPIGDAVSETSLSAINEAIPSVRLRERMRISNALKVEEYLREQNFLNQVWRPNTEHAAWIITIRSEAPLDVRRANSELFDQPLGLDSSSLLIVKDEASPTIPADFILSVGLEDPENVILDLHRLFRGN